MPSGRARVHPAVLHVQRLASTSFGAGCCRAQRWGLFFAAARFRRSVAATREPAPLWARPARRYVSHLNGQRRVTFYRAALPSPRPYTRPRISCRSVPCVAPPLSIALCIGRYDCMGSGLGSGGRSGSLGREGRAGEGRDEEEPEDAHKTERPYDGPNNPASGSGQLDLVLSPVLPRILHPRDHLSRHQKLHLIIQHCQNSLIPVANQYLGP